MKNAKIGLLSKLVMSVLMPMIAFVNLPYRIIGKVTSVSVKEAANGGGQNCQTGGSNCL